MLVFSNLNELFILLLTISGPNCNVNMGSPLLIPLV